MGKRMFRWVLSVLLLTGLSFSGGVKVTAESIPAEDETPVYKLTKGFGHWEYDDNIHTDRFVVDSGFSIVESTSSPEQTTPGNSFVLAIMPVTGEESPVINEDDPVSLSEYTPSCAKEGDGSTDGITLSKVDDKYLYVELSSNTEEGKYTVTLGSYSYSFNVVYQYVTYFEEGDAEAKTVPAHVTLNLEENKSYTFTKIDSEDIHKIRINYQGSQTDTENNIFKPTSNGSYYLDFFNGDIDENYSNYRGGISVQVGEDEPQPDTEVLDALVVQNEDNTVFTIRFPKGSLMNLPQNTNFYLDFTVPSQQESSSSVSLRSGVVDKANSTFTFTLANLEDAGEFIAQGNYVLSGVIRSPEYRKEFKAAPEITIPRTLNQPAPDAAIRFDSESKELLLECPQNGTSDEEKAACSAYLQTIYEHQRDGHPPYNFTFNSGIEIDRPEGYQGRGQYLYPSHGAEFDELERVPENPDSPIIALKVSYETLLLREQGEGEFVAAEIHAKGYATKYLNVQINIDLDLIDPNQKNLVDSVVQNNNFPYEVTIIGNKDYLETISSFGMTKKLDGMPSSCVLADGFSTLTDLGNGKAQLVVNAKALTNIYTSVDPGEAYAVLISSSNYKKYYSEKITIDHPFKSLPGNIQITPIGDGFSIRASGDNADIMYDRLTDNTKYPGFMYEYPRLAGTTEDGGRGKNFIASYTEDSTFKFIKDTTDNRIIAKATYSDLTTLGADFDEPYYLNLQLPTMGGHYDFRYKQNLNPIRLAHMAQHPESYSEAELQEADSLAITTENGGLKNVTVVEDNSTNDAGVGVFGEVAAAITTDNRGGAEISDLNYDDPKVEITVKTDVTNLTEDEAQQVIDQYDSDAEITPTSVHFDVSIEKSYKEASGKGDEPVEIKVLPYKAGLEFELPSEELPEGQYYHLLREHDGKVEEVTDFETVEVDGVKKGVAYSEKFSSFVLVTSSEKPSPVDPVTPSKPDNAVKPSSETQSNTKKNVSKHVDNVVTCQMAGYPAGYAWNEAAKACQPGFLDNAGVFHGTAVRKAGVPNTYDRGLGGSMAGLITSALTAIIAAYILKKY